MDTTGLVIRTRKKMNRMIIGLLLLLVIEFFALPHLVVHIGGLPGLMGPVTFAALLVSFLGALWLGNRITVPLLQMGEEAITHAMAKESGEGENH